MSKREPTHAITDAWVSRLRANRATSEDSHVNNMLVALRALFAGNWRDRPRRVGMGEDAQLSVSCLHCGWRTSCAPVDREADIAVQEFDKHRCIS